MQYNPSDTTKFVSTIHSIGIKTYTIANDAISPQNLLSINFDFYDIRFFGSSSYVATVSYSPNYLCIATINGDNIYSNFNYQLTETTGCVGIAILNDFDCYLACSGGVFRYRLTAFNMFYVG